MKHTNAWMTRNRPRSIFTGNRNLPPMSERIINKLSHFSSIFTVRRDGEFSTTGPTDSAITNVVTFTETKRFLDFAVGNKNVSAIIVPPSLTDAALRSNIAVAESTKAREAFFLLHNMVSSKTSSTNSASFISPDSIIAPTARVSPGAIIASGAEIRDFAFIGPGCEIGENAFVGEGALIGVDGHFEQKCQDRRLRVSHAGMVKVGAGAQILAGAIIQRDVFESQTTIGKDSVIGPGVKIAHGVQIGEDTVLTGGSLVAGYTTIGDHVWVGPGATIGNKLCIGNDVRIEIGAVVVDSVGPGQRVSGNFAISHTSNLRRWRSAGKATQ